MPRPALIACLVLFPCLTLFSCNLLAQALQVSSPTRHHAQDMAANGPSMLQATAQKGARKVSDDGRYLVFESTATTLVNFVTDNNGANDVFLHDRQTGVTTLLSRSAASAYVTAAGASSRANISADGAWVVFQSTANNLVTGQVDYPSTSDIFLYEVASGTLSLVSHVAASDVTTGNGGSIDPVISADGSYVVYVTSATNLVVNLTDTNGAGDVYLYNRVTTGNTLVSHVSGTPATAGNGNSGNAVISKNGLWVAYDSIATDLVDGITDTNNLYDSFLFSVTSGETILMSRSSAGAITSDGNTWIKSISADGAFVLISSRATDLVPGITDTNTKNDLFLYRRVSSSMQLLTPSSTTPNSAMLQTGFGSADGVISEDGNWIAAIMPDTDLVAGATDTNGFYDVYLIERSTGAITLVSDMGSTPGTAGSGECNLPVISAAGEVIAFTSLANNLISPMTDWNTKADAFKYTRATGAMQLASAAAPNIAANNESLHVALNVDGSVMLFDSKAHNIVANDLNGAFDVFVARDYTDPAMLVRRGTAVIAKGSTDDVPSISMSGASYTWTITNTSPVPLNLPGTPVVQANALNNCNVVLTQTSATQIAQGATSEFTFNVTPQSQAAWSFQVVIASDDPTAMPYAFTVSGTVAGSGGGGDDKDNGGGGEGGGGCVAGNSAGGLVLFGLLLLRRRRQRVA